MDSVSEITIWLLGVEVIVELPATDVGLLLDRPEVSTVLCVNMREGSTEL